MNDLMLDLETMGNDSDSVIVQIAMVMFDRQTGEIDKDTFLTNISIDSCLNKGMKVTGSTIEFWLKQTGRDFLDNTVSINTAIEAVKTYYQRKSMFGKNNIYLWSHATFDAVILSSAFKMCGVKSPFPYKNFRDIRTLTDLAQLDLKKTFTDKSGPQKDHNALHDCIFQISYCVSCFQRLDNKNKA